MKEPIFCQGGIQINTASRDGGAGVVSFSVDLPNGPTPGTIWVVDQCGMYFQDLSNTAVDPMEGGGSSGLYIVSVSSPPPDTLDTITALSLASRGVPIDGTLFFNEFGAATVQWGKIQSTHEFIVPSGYTIRAILTQAAGAAFTGPITLILSAQLRILQQQ